MALEINEFVGAGNIKQVNEQKSPTVKKEQPKKAPKKKGK